MIQKVIPKNEHNSTKRASGDVKELAQKIARVIDHYLQHSDLTVDEALASLGLVVVAGKSHGIAQLWQDLTAYQQAQEAKAVLAHTAALLAERNRIAQDFHDTLAQGFIGIKLQMEVAEEALKGQESEARRRIIRAREIAAESAAELRSTIRALRVPLLQAGSLAMAFNHLTEQASDDNKNIQFLTEGTPCPLPEAVEDNFYRIGQEALSNALQHSLAQNIVLRLRYSEAQVSLSIEDDGVGFDVLVDRKGYGLQGMEERAKRIGGEFSITSQPGRGAIIIVYLAYPLLGMSDA